MPKRREKTDKTLNDLLRSKERAEKIALVIAQYVYDRAWGNEEIWTEHQILTYGRGSVKLSRTDFLAHIRKSIPCTIPDYYAAMRIVKEQGWGIVLKRSTATIKTLKGTKFLIHNQKREQPFGLMKGNVTQIAHKYYADDMRKNGFTEDEIKSYLKWVEQFGRPPVWWW